MAVLLIRLSKALLENIPFFMSLFSFDPRDLSMYLSCIEYFENLLYMRQRFTFRFLTDHFDVAQFLVVEVSFLFQTGYLTGVLLNNLLQSVQLNGTRDETRRDEYGSARTSCCKRILSLPFPA